MSDEQWLVALDELAQAGALEWLQSDDFEVFCYYGFGVVLTEDQKKAAASVFADPESGLFHVWRWGNRSGKTTLLVLLHLYVVWKKWRFVAARFEVWERYVFRSLHTAPMNKLVGKAWALAESLLDGRAEQQQDPFTREFRPAPLGRFFTAGKSTLPDGSDALWVKCANGAVIDFLSTSDGAARVEGEAWWFISWDEFARQAPVTDVPLLIDQTFLPRSSDHMAPVLMAGTSTEDFDPVYQEIEDMAERQPHRWVFFEAGREGNFSQSKRSIDRQRDMSFDPSSVARSVDGGLGGGGKGPFPSFLLDNAFRDDLPQRTFKGEIPPGWIVAQSFDHALRHDDNVVLSAMMPWPITPERLLRDPITGVNLDIKRSSRSLTPDEQFSMCANNAKAYDPKVLVIDATAEGGLMVFRQARAYGLPAEACSFTGRTPGSIRVTNKEYGIQALQRMLGYGLDLRIGEDGWVEEWPDPSGRPFGLLRFPNHRGEWAKLKRQLLTYKRDDEFITQDAAMTAVMLAWWVYRFIDQGSHTHTQKFSVLGRKAPRTPRDRRVALRVR